MRTALNQASAVGLAAFARTDSALASATTAVRAQHIADLCAALSHVCVAAGLTPPTYTDPVIGAGMTMKAIYVAEIRAAVAALE